VLGQLPAVGGSGGLRALPIVEIVPAAGVYDYQAKYERSDTRYVVGPDLDGSGSGGSGALGGMIRTAAERVARAIGVRHLARVDFILGEGGEPMLLEVNTMPGFTATSLLPKAAAAVGLGFEDLCARLVELALHDAAV
jgi:D-alanine-D-alanine ligase